MLRRGGRFAFVEHVVSLEAEYARRRATPTLDSTWVAASLTPPCAHQRAVRVHVCLVDSGAPMLALAQRMLDPAQQLLAHGCHLQRDSPRVVVETFGATGLRRMERRIFDAMWPVGQVAAGIVEKA